MEIETKLVSVIMPAYNGEKFIEEAVQSMIAQSYSNWELIVVDDGSTDRTDSIIKNMSDSRIRYVYQENHGQASALNHGLRLAKGDYITTLDTDDWYTVDSLLVRVKYLNENPNDGVVYGDGIYCDVEGQPIMQFSDYRSGNVAGEVYPSLIISPFFGTGGNVMLRREVLEKHDIFYDESIIWCQDYDLYIRIAEHATFGVIDEVTIWYRLHDGNMTMSMPKGHRLKSLIKLRRKVLASFRFERVASTIKFYFFRYLILQDLNHHLDEQIEMLDHPRFQEMDRNHQAQLIRQLAVDYLITHQYVDEMRALLKRAWKLQPFDIKTVILVVLSNLEGRMVDRIFDYWHQVRLRKQQEESPFTRVSEKASSSNAYRAVS